MSNLADGGDIVGGVKNDGVPAGMTDVDFSTFSQALSRRM